MPDDTNDESPSPKSPTDSQERQDRETDPGADVERERASRRPGSPDEEPDTERGSERPESYESAKDELIEALDHFKNAAGFLFGRMAKDVSRETKEIAKDPVVQDAGKVVKRLGREAEPVVREMAGHVRTLSQRLLDLAAPPHRHETPPPPRKDDAEDDEK